MTSLMTGRTARLLAGALAAAWLVGSGAALAVEGSPSPSASDDQPITVFTGNPAAMALGGEADRLVQYVSAQGGARVIVGLRIVTRIESTLSDAEVSRQRQAQRGVEDAVLGRVFGSLAAASVQRYEFIPYMAVVVDGEQVSRLLADPQVVSVKKETIFEPALTETIPLIHADKVFAKNAQGTGYVVAVIDSGVSKTSPMLAGKVISEACYSSNIPVQNYSSFCPGGATSSLAIGSAVNCPLNVPQCDHGTHVASIAAGNSSVYDGVARDSRIIAIKVASRLRGPGCTPTPCLAILEGDVLLALKRVIALRNTFKIAAVNLSVTTRRTLFASQCDATNNELTAAFKSLRAADIAAIVAPGNNSSNNSVGIPACITSAIAVGNTTKNDLVWRSSNHSPLVDLMAPGTLVTAGVPPGSPCIQPAGGAAYCAKTGTSMAAPHVAGAFALLKSAKTHPSAAAILKALKCSGKVVYQRAVAGGAPTDLDPARWRIDVLGAYNYLIGPIGVVRGWSFAAKTELSDWTVVEGPWRFNAASPGTYEVGPLPAGGIVRHPLLTALANCHRSFTLDIRFKRTDTQPFLTSSGFWLKAVIDYDKHLISGYYFAFGKEKNPKTGEPGSASVTRIKNWAYRENLACKAENACEIAAMCPQKFVPISQSAFNAFKVVATGGKLDYLINGTNICSFTDATFASGAIVPYAVVLPPFEAGQVFQVDSLRLTSKDVSPATAPEVVDNVMDPSAFATRAVAGPVALDAGR